MIDLGFCDKSSGESGQGISEKILGTPGHGAPELNTGCCSPTEVDMFALGVLIFMLMTKNLPFALIRPKSF